MPDQRLTDKGAISSIADGDKFHVVDVSDTTSNAAGTSKTGLWSLIKSTLKTYFDTIYFSLTTSGQIDNLTEKSYPVDDDIVMINDSADSNSPKKVKLGNIRNTSFEGSRWCVFGDSTVNSLSGDWIGTTMTELGINSADVTINAVAGDKIADQLADLVTLLAGDANYMKGFEYCILAVGVNDHSGSTTLGDINDTAADTTVMGYFNDFIDTVYTSNPEIIFYVCTPLKYESSVFGWYGENYAYYTMADLAYSIGQVAQKWSTKCIDLFNTSGFNEQTGATLSDDPNPLHPNATGKVVVGTVAANTIRGGGNNGSTTPFNNWVRSGFTVNQGDNSVGTVFNIRNGDVSLLVDEELGRIQFISNDANPGAETNAGAIKCILEDAGFWYGLRFFPRGSSGEIEAMHITKDGFVRVKRDSNEAQLIVERTGSAASQLYCKVSQGVIWDYTNGATGYTFRIEGNDRMIIRENGEINMPALPTSSAGLVSGDLWNDSGTIKIV